MRYHSSRSRRSYWWSQSLTTIESALRSRSERYALPILLLKMFAHLGYFSLKSLGGTWMQRIRNRTAPLDGHACLSAKTHCSMALAEGPWGRWWKGQLKKIHTSCWSSHLQSFHLFTFKFYQAEHSPNSWWAVDKNNAKTGQAHLQLATHRRLYLFPFNHLRILPSSSLSSSSSANFINTGLTLMIGSTFHSTFDRLCLGYPLPCLASFFCFFKHLFHHIVHSLPRTLCSSSSFTSSLSSSVPSSAFWPIA